MSKINILEYIVEEAARVAADYNFYWTVGNTKDGIEVTFTTSNRYWSDTTIIPNKDEYDLSEEEWQKVVTILLEKNAEFVDDSEADYFAKKMCQKEEG
jgi:hypothetical protein